LASPIEMAGHPYNSAGEPCKQVSGTKSRRTVNIQPPVRHDWRVCLGLEAWHNISVASRAWNHCLPTQN